MKNTSFAFIFSLLTSSAFANPISLKCEFYEYSNLEGFTMTLDEEKAVLSFEGELSPLKLNPAGEQVLLERRRPFTANWMLYKGVIHFPKGSAEACAHSDFEGRCDSMSRAFDLSFSQVSLVRPGARSGSLSFTRVSQYVPAESFYSHDISCTEMK